MSYEGWYIEIRLYTLLLTIPDSFVSTVDLPASCQNLADLLLLKIQKLYPGANVESSVTIGHGYNYIRVSPPGGTNEATEVRIESCIHKLIDKIVSGNEYWKRLPTPTEIIYKYRCCHCREAIYAKQISYLDCPFCGERMLKEQCEYHITPIYNTTSSSKNPITITLRGVYLRRIPMYLLQ